MNIRLVLHFCFLLFFICFLLFFESCELLSEDNSDSKDEPINENSTFESAEFVVDLVTQSGVFINGGSKFYKFSFSTTCLIRIDVVDAAVEYRIAVYENDNSSSLVKRSSYIDTGENAQIFVGPLAPGNHYIELDPRNREEVSAEFNFKLVFDCSDTDELNNTFNTATEILSDGTPYSARILASNDGSSNYEDYDMIKFTNDKYGIAKIRFRAPEEIQPISESIEVTIFNDANDETELENFYVDRGETGEVILGPLAPGEHYIGINYKGECSCQSEQPYEISIEIDEQDIYEPNDSPSSAFEIQLETQYEGMLAYPNRLGVKDSDWFKFIPKVSGTYKALLIGTPRYPFSNRTGIPYTYLYFYDTPGGTYKKNVYIQGESSVEMSNLELEANHEYYFLINHYYNSSESDKPYKLQLLSQ